MQSKTKVHRFDSYLQSKREDYKDNPNLITLI